MKERLARVQVLSAPFLTFPQSLKRVSTPPAMSARPTYTTPVGSKFSFVLPPGWFAMITSVSPFQLTETES